MIYFEVPEADVSKWQKGQEPQQLLGWLQQRGRLNELRPAFKKLGFDDLIKYLPDDETNSAGADPNAPSAKTPDEKPPISRSNIPNRYFNPAPEVKTIGRAIRSGAYRELLDQLRPGEVLIALLTNGVGALVAAEISSRERLDELNDIWGPLNFYAVPTAKAEEGFGQPATKPDGHKTTELPTRPLEQGKNDMEKLIGEWSTADKGGDSWRIAINEDGTIAATITFDMSGLDPSVLKPAMDQAVKSGRTFGKELKRGRYSIRDNTAPKRFDVTWSRWNSKQQAYVEPEDLIGIYRFTDDDSLELRLERRPMRPRPTGFEHGKEESDDPGVLRFKRL